MRKSFMKMNDSNDLLGIILKVQNSNGDFLFTEILELVGESRSLDVLKYIKTLSEEGYVKISGTNDGHCYPHARKAYISNTRKIWNKIFPILLSLFAYLIGLINDDVKELFHVFITILINKICGA